MESLVQEGSINKEGQQTHEKCPCRTVNFNTAVSYQTPLKEKKHRHQTRGTMFYKKQNVSSLRLRRR